MLGRGLVFFAVVFLGFFTIPAVRDTNSIASAYARCWYANSGQRDVTPQEMNRSSVHRGSGVQPK